MKKLIKLIILGDWNATLQLKAFYENWTKSQWNSNCDRKKHYPSNTVLEVDAS